MNTVIREEKHKADNKERKKPPEDDELLQNNCCLLCQCVNRPLSPLFSSDSSVVALRKSICKCLNISITFENDANASVCTDCIERLKSLSWFDHQGKSNDLFLKHLPEEFFSEGELYCRLCLATKSHLQPIFLNGGLPDSSMCDIIKECIGIELNCYRDFGAQICPMCRTQLEMFATFKRISKQIRAENLSKRASKVAEDEHDNATESMEEFIGFEDNEESLLEVMSAQDEPAVQKTKSKRKQNVQPKKNVSKRAKLQALPDEPPDNSDIWAKTSRMRVFRMLWIADDERNFEVIKEKKGRARIAVDGHRFYYSSTKPDGSSVWFCDWRILHACKYQVNIGADGKFATFGKNMIHKHEVDPVRLLKCPLGKGLFLHSDGTEEPFWLISALKAGQEYERQLIYRGQRYTLRNIDNLNDTSTWQCRTKKCRVTIEIRGVFKFVSQSKETHSHPEVSNQEVLEALRACKVNPKADDVITAFLEKKAPDWQSKASNLLAKLALPEIYTKLACEDPDRTFDVFKIRDNLFKIRYIGYYYKYSQRVVDGSTLWKCIWESVHNCMAMVVLSADGLQAAYYGLVEHSHPVKTADIFDCELKVHSVRNITSDVKERMQLLSRECFYFQSRSLLYHENVFNLYQIINSSETRWSCVKLGPKGQPCPALLIINGQLESFLRKGEHCHLPMSKSEIKSIIKPGNVLDLSALKHGEQLSRNDAAVNSSSEASGSLLSMLKQQLFTFPAGRGSIWDRNENKNFPFYFLTDNARKQDNPYKFFYQQYRYSFASIDAYGTSQWICCKLLETDTRQGTCTAHLTIEGVFQRVTAKGKHNHEGLPDSMVEYLCSKNDITK